MVNIGTCVASVGKMQQVPLLLTDEELVIINKWRDLYISENTPNTIIMALHDMIKKIADDMNDMEQ